MSQASASGDGEPAGPWPRLAAAAGVAGGLVWVALPLVFALVVSGRRGATHVLTWLLAFAAVGVVCMAVSLAGLHHFWGRARYGRRGRFGFVLTLAGFALLLPGSAVPAGALSTRAARVVPLAFLAGLLLVAVGQAMLGIAARRAAVLPAPVAALLVWALPAGSLVGILASWAGAGTLALAVALLVAVGLPWVAVGAACWRAAAASTRPDGDR